MVEDTYNTNGAAELRRKAEEKVNSQQPSTGEVDAKRLQHELQVHQVELEMQNEEQRRTLAELRGHKARLENVIKNTPAGYFHIDLEGHFLNVNKAWLLMHGYESPDEVVGKHFSIMQVDSGSDSALAHLAELQRGVAIPHGEYSSRRKDGSVAHHIFSAHPVVSYEKIVGFEWFVIDISQRRQVEEVLRESEKRYSLILTSVNDGLWDWHVPSGEAIFSELYYRILGYDYGEFPANYASWRMLVHPDDIERVEQNLRQSTESGKIFNIDLRMKTKSGEWLWVCTRGNTVEKDTEGKTIRIVGTLSDISDRKKLEEEKGILQQQFQQAQKLESLGVLTGGIAHDFNNILAIIMGYCGLTKMDYDTAEKHIPIIENAVERAAALCRQMLAYAGKASLTETLVVMWVLVDDVVTMLKATIRQNVVIKTCYTSDIPSIMGDASQLRQIVMNLIINASESIGDLQGEVCVSLSKAVIKAGQAENDHNGKTIPPGEYVCLEVTDSGCGMDDETRRRIFEPFYTTKFTGRGLGMSAVLGIIKAHNGALQLSSQSGHGTTFKVYLPAQIGTANEEEAQQTVSAPWEGSGTILLAEDEEHVALIEKAMLEALGFKVIGAADGKEALELYKKNAADITLVIADMGMPVMDGYELFRELKKLKPELPIIVSSGFGDAEVTSRIPREQIAGLVSKPYHYDQLRDVLKKVVEGYQKQA